MSKGPNVFRGWNLEEALKAKEEQERQEKISRRKVSGKTSFASKEPKAKKGDNKKSNKPSFGRLGEIVDKDQALTETPEANRLEIPTSLPRGSDGANLSSQAKESCDKLDSNQQKPNKQSENITGANIPRLKRYF